MGNTTAPSYPTGDPAPGEYQRITVNSMDWQVDRFFIKTADFNTLSKLDAGHRPDDSQLVQRRKGHYSWFFPATSADGQLFIKQYHPRNTLNRLQYVFRKNRAHQEFHSSIKLTKLGIPVPKLLAWGERKNHGVWSDSILIYTGYTNCVNLKNFNWNRTGLDKILSNQIDSLACDLARLHENGVYFGDLHSGNILLVDHQQCMLTDLDKVRFLNVLPEHLWIDDIALLNAHIDASPKVKLAFLKKYCRYRKLSESSVLRKKLVQRTGHHLRKHAAKQDKKSATNRRSTTTR